MDLQQVVENEGNPKNEENSCCEVVIDKLRQDSEVESSEKQQVDDFPKAGGVKVYYLFEIGMGEGGSCEAAEVVGLERTASE
jgi:hypothetical protein